MNSYLQPGCDALRVEGMQAGKMRKVFTRVVAGLADHTSVTAEAHTDT